MIYNEINKKTLTANDINFAIEIVNTTLKILMINL